MKTKIKQIEQFITKLYCKITDPQTSLLPASLTFYTILSFIPILSFASLIIRKIDVVVLFKDLLPANLYQLIHPFIININNGNFGLLSITTFITIYISSKGMYALIRIINQMYHFEDKNIVVNYLKAILTMFLLILSTAILIFSLGLLPIILDYLKLPRLDHVLTLPFILFILFFIIMIIFSVAPNQRISLKSIVPGAAFTTLGIVLSTYGFSIYMSQNARYSTIYGSVTNLIFLSLCYIY